jgi:hypothetical protein
MWRKRRGSKAPAGIPRLTISLWIPPQLSNERSRQSEEVRIQKKMTCDKRMDGPLKNCIHYSPRDGGAKEGEGEGEGGGQKESIFLTLSHPNKHNLIFVSGRYQLQDGAAGVKQV